MRCVIFGAGEYGKFQYEREENDYTIAADGGLDRLVKNDMIPDAVIGDMDSLTNAAYLGKAQERGTQVIRLPREKDDTDMLAAIKLGLEKGCEEFVIYGGTGGRLDHTIANIQCLIYLKNRNKTGILMEEKGRIELIRNERKSFPKDKKGIFSVFAVGADAYGVTEKGLKYELEHAIVRQEFPIGISNEFTGTESYIEVENGTLLLYTADME